MTPTFLGLLPTIPLLLTAWICAVIHEG